MRLAQTDPESSHKANLGRTVTFLGGRSQSASDILSGGREIAVVESRYTELSEGAILPFLFPQFRC